MAAIVGGNNICHCIHVTELNTRLAALESWERSRDEPIAKGPGPLQHTGWQPAAEGPGPSPAPAGAPTPGPAPGKAYPRALPLELKGPLMAIGWKDRPLLDEKLALQDDFRFNGVKNGPEWKENIEKAIIPRAPVEMVIP